ncbi:MAG: hypothetical protein H6741_18490 [Alphaproteobacteria bacterium]|nr:hypothetical protein [Alphaproteobacteria bacterium]MCB9794705.1 hypothetical protein [Alphaproteobacteria bacterium]
MTLKNMTLLALGLGLLSVTGCGDEDGGETDDSSETVDSEDSSTDDSGEPEISVAGTVTGTVTVVLYDDSSGDIESVEYADVGYNSFPFGKIFIAAYTQAEDDEGNTVRTYHGDTTIDSPTIGGDAYSMDVEVEGTDEVYVYAHLDWHQDRVLGSDEPSEHYPALVTIPDGGEISEINITILAPVYCSERANANCGGSCDTTTISGEVLISVSYAGGDVATFLQGTDGSGPSYVSWMTPTADAGGASGAYSMSVCENAGTRRLRGAWDSNGNELIDPRDRWGSYSTGNDESGDPEDSNPISVGTSALSGYDVVIPLGDEDGFSVVPFTVLSGTVGMEVGGLFDETLPANTNVHIAALRYRPNLDISLSSLETAAYSSESWTWAELQGAESKSFILPVPADTIVYLWAYGDTDADDVLNESGEFVGVPNGASTGRIPTGSDGYNGLEVLLAQP